MACANHWTTSLQVGSHHIARTFIRNGWKIAFISDPISPAHFLKPSSELKKRYFLYKSGGLKEQNLWTYVPGALLTPYNCSFLKSSWIHANWAKLTFPSIISKVKQQGFDKPDLLYIDSPFYAFWLDLLSPKYSIYRLADYTQAFRQTAPAKKLQEKALLSSVDCVIYTAKSLKQYITTCRPKRMEYIPNGVDVPHFTKQQCQPPDYQSLQGPIAVYAGTIREWFDTHLLCAAARALPNWQFVIIGPNEGQKFEPLPNLHLIGPRPWKNLPAYLQHATVGIIPFNVEKWPELIHRVNPLKLYEYMASGLPVVSMQWDELVRLKTPALLASSKQEFIALIEKAKPSKVYRNFAMNHDWSYRGRQIIELCRNPAKTASRARF